MDKRVISIFYNRKQNLLINAFKIFFFYLFPTNNLQYNLICGCSFLIGSLHIKQKYRRFQIQFQKPRWDSIYFSFFLFKFRNSMVIIIGNKSRIPNVKNMPTTTHSKLLINHSNVSQSNKYKIYYKILNTNQRYAIKRKVHINKSIE